MLVPWKLICVDGERDVNTECLRNFRWLELGLLFIAMIGPWAFDRIIVPVEYPCTTAVRLEGDYCGFPLSGLWMLWAVISEFWNRVIGLIAGTMTFAEWSIGFRLFLSALVIVLPVFTTVSMLWTGNRPPLQKFNFAAWGLAVGICLLFAVSSFTKFYWQLWGIWLYIGLAISSLVIEGLMLMFGRKTLDEG